MAQEKRPSDAWVCPICADDITSPPSAAEKHWRVESVLKRHLEDTYHSPKSTAARLYDMLGCSVAGGHSKYSSRRQFQALLIVIIHRVRPILHLVPTS